ncbi:MAG: hypothetical protein ICV64_11875 [Thermoleophilia bacterium]|nr:hypothetical protein [Thermoleophilia bacterium]
MRSGVALLVSVLALCGAGASALPGATDARRGGTFRLALSPDVGAIDPALATSPPEEMLVRTTCTPLMAFPGPRPEAAVGPPKVSRGGRVYTFTIRRGLRFNTGEPVTARNFARAVTRLLSPAMRAEFTDHLAERLVGGRAFREGKTQRLAGVVARGRTLVFRLRRPWGHLVDEVATGRFCPVPLRLPVDPEGVGAPLPGSGPYFVSRFVPGREIVLVRNRLYRGRRAQHVDRFVADLTNTFTTSSQEVVEGRADLATAAPDVQANLVRRYGVNRSQLWVSPDPNFVAPRILVLNTQRPLFRNNARLRRAVSLAIDRRAVADIVGRGLLATTDQFLSPLVRGFREVRISPPRGDLRRARGLARGRTRGGKAVLYVTGFPPFARAQAELVKANLRRIGLDVETRVFPHAEYLRRLYVPGEPFDMAFSVAWGGPYPTHSILNELFHGRNRPPAGENFFRFNSPRFNRLLDRAERLTGAARSRLYGRIDAELARDAVPAIPLFVHRRVVLVSRRAGCVDFRKPLYELSRLCLKS